VDNANSSEQLNTSQYSPATMLAAGKFKRYIKRPPKPEDSTPATVVGGGAAGSRRGSQDHRRRSATRLGSQEMLSNAGGGRAHAGRHGGSQDKLASGRRGAEAVRRSLLRLSGLEMGRTKSDSQRRRKGFGLLPPDTGR
jgi:hypothetical protein